MAQSPWTFDPQGNLGVWTGQGYDYSAPTSFGSDALKTMWRGGDMGSQTWDSEDAMRQAYANYSGDTPWAQAYKTYALDPGNGTSWSPLSSNYALNYDPNNPNSMSLQMKSADKQGTTIGYVRDPATGKWTLDPNAVRQNFWDTNKADDALKGFLSPIAIGAGAGVAAGALGATGAPTLGSMFGTGGMSAAEGAALGSEAAGGITGIGAGGMSAADAAAAAGLGGAPAMGGAGTSILGDVVPAGAQPGFGLTPGLEQIATGAAPGGTVSSSLWDTISQRLQQGQGIGDLVQKFTGGPANTSQGKVGGTGNSFLDLLAGVYGARQTKDMSGNLKDMYSAALGRQKPFIDQLMASYMDPNSYYNSNEYRGLADIYKNQIDRQAAAKGRMANPTDREVLLQKHALQNLDEYRKTLTGNINALDPSRYADPYAKGVMAEAYANTPLFTAAGAMGGAGGGGVGNVINTLAQAGSTAEDIWKLVSGWFA